MNALSLLSGRTMLRLDIIQEAEPKVLRKVEAGKMEKTVTRFFSLD